MGQVRSQKSFWIVWDLRLDAIFLPKVFSLSIPKRLFSFARILRQALAEFLSQSKSNDSFGECGILSTWPNDNFDCAIKFARCPSTTGIQRQVWGQAADSSNGLHTFPNRILNDFWTILMQLMQKAGISNRFLWMNRSRFVPTILDKGMLFFRRAGYQRRLFKRLWVSRKELFIESMKRSSIESTDASLPSSSHWKRLSLSFYF